MYARACLILAVKVRPDAFSNEPEMEDQVRQYLVMSLLYNIIEIWILKAVDWRLQITTPGDMLCEVEQLLGLPGVYRGEARPLVQLYLRNCVTSGLYWTVDGELRHPGLSALHLAAAGVQVGLWARGVMVPQYLMEGYLGVPWGRCSAGAQLLCAISESGKGWD